MSSFINKKIIKSNNFKLSEITHHKILINEIKTINLKISICIHCYDINIFEELMYYINNFFYVLGTSEKINVISSVIIPLLILTMINSIFIRNINAK